MCTTFKGFPAVLSGFAVVVFFPCFSRSVWKHFRGLSMCLFLLVFPVVMAYKISQFFHMDFWLLILVSSCMLTSLQVWLHVSLQMKGPKSSERDKS